MKRSILLIFMVLLIFWVTNYYLGKKVYEHFEDKKNKSWTQSDEDYQKEHASLNSEQVNEVKNIASEISKNELSNLITAQSPLLTGPQGPQGPQGPPGTTLIASGRLGNKKGSFEEDHKTPSFLLTRSEGTSPTASLAFMDKGTPFVSYQRWQLDINNQLKNKFDGTCLTMSNAQDNVYMDTCDSNNPMQKWSWDNTNRIISTSLSTNEKLKCLGLTSKKTEKTTSLPGCKGENCLIDKPKNYVVVKDCAINNIQDDEVWDFI